MRVVLLVLLSLPAFGEDFGRWPIERPKADSATGLRAPRLLRIEKGVGHTKKLRLSWTDRILKRGSSTWIVTNMKLDIAIRVKKAAEFFRHVEIPIKITAATIDGKSAMPTLKDPHFTARMLITGEFVDGLAAHGMGESASALRRQCALMMPAVPLREYAVGDVLDIPADRFVKQLGIDMEGASVAGKVYHQMPEALFHAGRSATVITTFSLLVSGEAIELPSGKRAEGKLRVKGRRTATYVDIARGGHLESCVLEMQSEYKLATRPVIRIETLAKASGERWSPPPTPKRDPNSLEDGARLRWSFRPGHRYGFHWEHTRERDGKKSSAALDGSLHVEAVKDGRAQFRMRLALDLDKDVVMKGTLNAAGRLEAAILPDVDATWKRRLTRLFPALPKKPIVRFNKTTPVALDEFRSWGLLPVEGGTAKGTVKQVATRPYTYLVILSTTFDVRITGDDLTVEGAKGAGEVHLKGTIETRMFMAGKAELTGIIYINRSTARLEATVRLRGPNPVASRFSDQTVFLGRYPEPPGR